MFDLLFQSKGKKNRIIEIEMIRHMYQIIEHMMESAKYTYVLTYKQIYDNFRSTK